MARHDKPQTEQEAGTGSAEGRSEKELRIDREFWQEALALHRASLVLLVRKRLVDKNRVEGILQDIALKLAEFPPPYKPINSPAAYLVRCAINAVHDANRERRPDSLDDPAVGETLNPRAVQGDEMKVLEDNEAFALLRQRLTTPDKAILELWLLGHSCKEMATIRGISDREIRLAQARIRYQARRLLRGFDMRPHAETPPPASRPTLRIP